MTRSEKKAYRQSIQVHFTDEVPRIGSGMRHVIPEVGRKWVRLRTPHGATGRVSVERWAKLTRSMGG